MSYKIESPLSVTADKGNLNSFQNPVTAGNLLNNAVKETAQKL